MAYALRSYGGGAVVAQLVEEMGADDMSFTIAPTTGWTDQNGNPLGTTGNFVVVVDRFTGSVEKILCSAINLTTGLVSAVERGYDGTTEQAHVPGGSPAGVQTCWSSVEAFEANTAVNALLGQTPTMGQALTWNGTAPAYATLPGLQSVSLFGVGTPAAGSSPPSRLTGTFYLQAGVADVVFASGFAAFAFPQAFLNGCMSGNFTLASGTTPGVVLAYAYSAFACELVLYIGASGVAPTAYSGGAALTYTLIGW